MKNKFRTLMLIAIVAIGIGTNLNITSNTAHNEYVAQNSLSKITVHANYIDPGW